MLYQCENNQLLANQPMHMVVHHHSSGLQARQQKLHCDSGQDQRDLKQVDDSLVNGQNASLSEKSYSSMLQASGPSSHRAPLVDMKSLSKSKECVGDQKGSKDLSGGVSFAKQTTQYTQAVKKDGDSL